MMVQGILPGKLCHLRYSFHLFMQHQPVIIITMANLIFYLEVIYINVKPEVGRYDASYGSLFDW